VASQLGVGGGVGEQNPVVLISSVPALTLAAEKPDNLEQLARCPKRSSDGILEPEQLLTYGLTEQNFAGRLVHILFAESGSSNDLPPLDGEIVRRLAPEARRPISASVDRLKGAVNLRRESSNERHFAPDSLRVIDCE
jgi:hypothetical protein